MPLPPENIRESGAEYPLSRWGRVRCISMSRQTKKRCKAYPVHGSQHCRYHGGRHIPKDVLKMSPRYSSVIKNDILREKYIKAVGDPDVTDMKDDLALMRAMCEVMVERCFPKDMENPQSMSVERIGAITDLVNKINRLVGQIVEREKNLGSYVQFERVKGLIDKVVSTIQTHVHDPEVVRKIAKELTSDKEFQDGLQGLKEATSKVNA